MSLALKKRVVILSVFPHWYELLLKIDKGNDVTVLAWVLVRLPATSFQLSNLYFVVVLQLQEESDQSRPQS